MKNEEAGIWHEMQTAPQDGTVIELAVLGQMVGCFGRGRVRGGG